MELEIEWRVRNWKDKRNWKYTCFQIYLFMNIPQLNKKKNINDKFIASKEGIKAGAKLIN